MYKNIIKYINPNVNVMKYDLYLDKNNIINIIFDNCLN